MRIIVCEDYNEMSAKAAELVAAQITLRPNSVLGLATGSTPIQLYNELAKMNQEGKIDFSEISSFNLDEYYPIKRDNPNSYYKFMRDNLFSKINIDLDNTHIPDGEAENPEEECKRYEALIKKSGGIDLQILGIGRNGHIGFNEPDSVLNSGTHLASLTESTIKANSRFFDSADEVPRFALTMGMATILSAKKIILMASGVSKSSVISELLGDGINMSVPAALLKTHPDVVLLCDRDAYTGVKFGVDIGGTNIKFAVVEGNEVKYKHIIETSSECDEIIADISAAVNDIKQQYGIKAVGVGTPGIINNGLVTAANLPFDNTPLEKLLSEKTGFAVTVDNDANCAALGEIAFGVTKDCDNIILITLGTGVGGGIIINRQIYTGTNGGGEIGHIIIQTENGKACPCGQSGCWERYVSANALIASAEQAAKNNKDSILYELYCTAGNRLDGELIFTALGRGCEVAREVFDEYIHYLAVGIRNLANIFAPDAIVLAGGITKQGDAILLPLKAALPYGLRVEISTLQNDAGALGAAML